MLAAIRAAGSPVAVDELATATGLHPNTVRFHAAALERDGLVEPLRLPSGARGRPRTAYRATRQGERAGERNYRLLAEVLVEGIANGATAGPDRAERPAAAARRAGRAWGRRLPRSGRGRTRRTMDALAALGFEPEARPVRRPTEVLLHNCPFLELVDTHRDVVCALHAGIIEGVAEDTPEDTPAGDAGAHPGGSTVLEPFVTPSCCRVRLG